MCQGQAVFDRHDQCLGHHVREVECFSQTLRLGPPEGFLHYCRDVIWVPDLLGQNVEGDDVVGVGRVNVDHVVAGVGVGRGHW